MTHVISEIQCTLHTHLISGYLSQPPATIMDLGLGGVHVLVTGRSLFMRPRNTNDWRKNN